MLLEAVSVAVGVDAAGTDPVILAGSSTAPFAVSDILMRMEAPTPTQPPQLPPEVTDVWLMSTWRTGTGFRWNPEPGWSAFEKLAGSASCRIEVGLCAHLRVNPHHRRWLL